MELERQVEILQEACERVNLDTHIKIIERTSEAYTYAEKIISRFRKPHGKLPVKNSFMHCDALDMCFSITENGEPVMSYAGYAVYNSSDLLNGKLKKAFEIATDVLQIMHEIIEENKESD